MKVKAAGMGEKPADTATSTDGGDLMTGGQEGELDAGLEDECCGGIPLEPGEEGRLSDVGESTLEGEEEEEDGEEEGDLASSQASKPVPPPRSDSHSVSYKVKHMVDSLPTVLNEEPFNWDVQREYLLACMGFVNGLGCLLQFATLTVKHGGGAFFVAYVVCMCVIGCPLVYLETTLGQYANGGPVAAWKVIPLFQGLGYSMVCITFLISTYYIMEVTWAIYYFGITMVTAIQNKRLPWDCTNRTDEHCTKLMDQVFQSYLRSTNLPQQLNNSITSLYQTSEIKESAEILGATQYFYNVVLKLPPKIGEFGHLVWYLTLCLLLAWLLVYVCLIYGPSSIGKVMYITAPYPYIGLIVLFVFLCLEEGSLSGIRFFLNPSWEKLANVKIWRDAAQLMVYTLSLGTGCLHMLAGYTHFHSHCFRNLLLICLCNVMGTVLAGFTMCSGLGVLSNITNISIHHLTLTEYELGFALFPYVLSQMPNSNMLTMVFFSVIIVIGLDSLMVLIQNIVGALTDILKDAGHRCSRLRRWLLQLVLCSMLFSVGLVFTTQGGLYATCYMSHFFCHVSQFVVVMLECYLLMYIFGARKFTHNIEDMTGNKDSPWWLWNWKFVSPFFIMGWVITTMFIPGQLEYKGLQYADWAEILGWCLSVLPLVCIPAWGLHKLRDKQGTFKQRYKALLKTPPFWGAGLHHSREEDFIPPDYVICQPDNHRPMHGLAMLTANLYVPHLTALAVEEGPQETASEMTGGYLSDLMTITSTDSIDSATDNEERGNWRGKLEFILSCLGYVLGLGNIWRFPYLVYRNGGGAFFIPYLIMMVFCGLPLMYMEMAFGQYASLGPVTIWRAVPIFKGVGYAMVVTIAIIAIYYNMIIAWAFHFFFASFSSTLPWSTCDNSWNTKACSMNKFLVTNCSLINETYLYDRDISAEDNSSCVPLLQNCLHSDNKTMFLTQNVTDCIDWLQKLFGEGIFLPERQRIVSSLKGPSEEYFYNSVLNQSEGLQNMGPVQWQLALFLLLCWFIVFMCLVRGIYSAGKVAYVVVIIPVLLLLILLVCSLLVDGHLEGIRFYVTPQWDKVLTFQVWSDAASQVFFSLSSCSGGLITLSSYNKFHNNMYRDALIICLVDTLMSILAGFTVFASMGILAVQLNTTVDNVVQSNIGLVFVAFPAAVTNFEPATMWSIFFFLMIIMMGMSTIVVITEVIVTVIIDEHVQLFRKGRILVLLATCLVLYLLGLPLTTRGGSHLIQLVDEFCGSTPNIIIGIFMCTALAWIYRVQQFSMDVQIMVGSTVSWWWRVMWCFVTPVIMFFVLISTVINTVKLDPESYPPWSESLGIALTVASVISIPLYAFVKVLKTDGTLLQRLKAASRSEDNWGPAQVKHWKHVEYYPAVNTHTLSVDMEHSPVHAITDHVDFSTSEVRRPHLSQTSLLPVNHSPRKPQELRQKAILNHAYSNPQCSISNGSIDQIKPQLSLQELPGQSDIIIISRKQTNAKCKDVATQTDARSYTLAIKQGSVKTLYKEMAIEEKTNNVKDAKLKPNQVVTQVEITKF